MQSSVFIELRFWLLMVLSIVAPIAIYYGLLVSRSVSPRTVLALGLLLTLLSGVDVYLLQTLSHLAQQTASLADDAVFLSELSVALCVLPVLFGGVGVNLVSHVLVRHLGSAERRFDEAQRNDLNHVE